MSAGKRFEYHWQDTSTVEYRRPVRLSAPEYIDCLFAWAQRQLDDDTIFPSAVGAPFPPKFEATVKALLRRLFRVYAHIYLSHFQQICALKIEGACAQPHPLLEAVCPSLPMNEADVYPGLQPISTHPTVTFFCLSLSST